jgi:DNA polymerase-1
MFGGDEYLINLNSGQQIMAEFGRMGIVLEDTSEATLNKHSHPAIKKLLEYRSHEKTLGSFGEGLLAQINPVTKRIHPDFIQYGADTGRFSCSNPNVQQIPATSDFRACFIAPEGYKLVTCDYSQAELRILAELSGDPAFLGAFRDGGDLHKLAASQMFQVAVDQVSKEQRSAAKAINFGLAYGMGPQGLAVRIDKTVDEARELINAYFKAFSGVQKWLEKAGRDSVRLSYSPTPLGRKRFYNSLNSDDQDFRRRQGEIERQGKNAPIQGCNADMTKMALVFLRERLQGYAARIVNTVHDEIVVEVREDQAEEVCKLVEHEMIRAGQEILKEVPIVADAKIGDYWSK